MLSLWQSGHLKKNCPMLTSTKSMGKSVGQPRVVVPGTGKTVGRPSGSIKSVVGSSFGT